MKYVPWITSTSIMKGGQILLNIFSTTNEMINVCFVFQSVYVVVFLYWFKYIEPFHVLWEEANLIIVGDLVVLFVDLVRKYFIEIFCMYVDKWYSFIIFFPSELYVLGQLWSHKRNKEMFLQFLLEKQFEENWHNFSL